MRIFVSPLDWGLGHAARCVPIIRYLLEKKTEVVIGAEGLHLIFLRERFPSLEFIELPGYRISYSETLPVGIKVLLQLPQMVSAINKEHKLLREIAETKKIDAVLSDNRYGLWNKKIPSAIITHQINIQAPAGNSLLSKSVQNYVKRFDECWIPDYAGRENLSGILSHPIPGGINGTYIGPLSRFESNKNTQNSIYDLLVILSGPEPQRRKLEELILKQLKELPAVKALIVQGLPGNKLKESGLKNVTIVPYLSDKDFLADLCCSETILSRPGYSTIMDLHTTGWKKAIFIPTPGQTEQEYLGNLMQEKGVAIACSQKRFLLKEAMEKANQINIPQSTYASESYKGIIDAWLKKIGR